MALARVAARVENIDVRLNAAQILMATEGHGEACAQVLLSVLQEECDKGWKFNYNNSMSFIYQSIKGCQ